MKLVVTLTFLTAAVAVASAGKVNWSEVKPLHVEPSIPLVPQSHRMPSGRITRGQEAARNQFPYQVGLLLYAYDGNYWCGGSVISDRWVLTAAHCTVGLTTGVDVYLGTWNRKDSQEKGQQRIFVETKHVIVHEAYNETSLVNDICLIKLPVVIEFNEYIQPVNLPKRADSYSTYAGMMAIASGWGLTSDSDPYSSPDILRWIKVPIMENKVCSRYYLGTVKPTTICIKTTGGISTCSGDSGGPLVLADGSNTLIGATSYGVTFGCEVGWPDVFTRITSYLDWIQENSGVTSK